MDIKPRQIFIMVVLAISLFELAVSFYLPILSDVRHNLHATEAYIQLSVSSYLIGLGLASLIFGSLSDIIGRRKVYITAVAIFTIASYLCSTATTAFELVFFRLLQGIGGGGGWPLGNAILHDVYSGKKFSQKIILLHTITGIIPLASIFAGGFIGELIGWRNSFVLISVLSLVFLVVSYKIFSETNKLTDTTSRKKDFLTNYVQVLKSRKYNLNLIIKVIIVAVLFVFMANIPLIYAEKFNLSAIQTSFTIMFGSLIYMCGSMVSQNLSNKIKLEAVITIGVWILAVISAVYIILAPQISNSLILTIISTVPVSFAFAFIFGPSTSCVVSSAGKLSGSGSALMLALEMAASSIGIYIVSLFYNKTLFAFFVFTFICAIISLYTLKKIKDDEANQ
jgi:DHA1 family bicyclomycin/chloramphenicol resistance-like MFS transporter